MRIAVPVTTDGYVYQRFSQAIFFRLYDTEEEEILSVEDITIEEGNKANVLADLGIEALMCGNLDPESMVDVALRQIEIIGGVQGKADKTIRDYLALTLEQNDMVVECGGEGSICTGNCSSCHH